ncbi:sugar ABC transporter permease [Mycoplasma sp. 744]|uniref:carbohydrate ABC transporter permease n=1 Tax=unclassified Mycoplasma TaxID=2683645 RepID=UPI00211CA93E|nr:MULTISPECIES: sugar ABC transporter permease [unclassified Mycoplasma]MEA4115364.1 sugar ABC transporter permease [Mycoplasma sp. 744]UUM19368.1 sugar ABC transporter permease [Mycoplasma sp. 1018B]
MKFSNQVWSKVAFKFPFLYKLSAKKQSENRAQSLSGSIIDKPIEFYKPLGMLLPTLIIITFFTIIPLFLNIRNAFFQLDDNQRYYFTFNNFLSVLNDPAFAVGFRNSIIYGLIVLPFVISISLLISSLIANVIRKAARGFWQTIFFLPYMTNAVAVALFFSQIYSPVGFVNEVFNLGTYGWLESGDQFSFRALLPIVTQGIWNGLAFNILIATTAMLSVDKNLYRSASIDGIGSVKQFFTIALPSIKSTTKFLITMGIINGTKVFPLAIFNNVPNDAIINGASSLMLIVYRFTKAANFPLAGSAALCLFLIGVFYSSLIRGGFNTILRVSLNKGEFNVWNRIKDSKVMIEYKAQKK